MSEPAANSQYDTHLSPQQQQQQKHKYLSSSDSEASPPTRNMVKKLTKASLYLVENCKPKEGKLH